MSYPVLGVVINPVSNCVLLSRQGPRPRRRTWHNGVDLGAPRGTPVRVIADGEVILVSPIGTNNGYGNLVVIKHDPTTLSAYAHLDTIIVSQGDVVTAGDRIGTVGTTFGTVSQPTRQLNVPHLHLEITTGWPLGTMQVSARYDVLGVLAANGLSIARNGSLVACTPFEYEEPLLASARAKGASFFDGYTEIIDATMESVKWPILAVLGIGMVALAYLAVSD